MSDLKANRFIKWIQFYLRMAAILPSLRVLDVARVVYYVCAMSVACVSGWYMFYLKYNDFSQNTDALLHAVLLVHTLFVYNIYLTNRDKLGRIAKHMNERFAHHNLQLGLCRYHQLWDRADNLSLLMMRFGSVCCLVMYSAYFFNAFSFSSYRKLLYPIWVPFSINNDFNYAITVILQLTIFSLYSFIHVSGCGFCIGGSHFIGASYEVLGQVFQDFFSSSESHRVFNSQGRVERKLKWFVEAHLELLR